MSKENVIVISNEARLLQFQIRHGDASGLIQLQPGANEVAVDDWKAVKELKSCQVFLSTQTSNPLAEGKPMALVEAQGLPALDELGAEKLLHHTFDKKLLAKWHEKETRDGIRLAIKKRQTEIDTIEKNAMAEVSAKGGSTARMEK